MWYSTGMSIHREFQPQRFSTFLTIQLFNTVPHVVVGPNHNMIFIAPHNCNFAPVMNCNANPWYAGHRMYDPQGGCDPRVEDDCSREEEGIKRKTRRSRRGGGREEGRLPMLYSFTCWFRLTITVSWRLVMATHNPWGSSRLSHLFIHVSVITIPMAWAGSIAKADPFSTLPTGTQLHPFLDTQRSP